MPKAIDANLILRYLLDDPEAPKVEKLLKNKKQKLILPDVVGAEVVWTLDSFYNWKRTRIADFVTTLIHLPTVRANEKVLTKTLDTFKNKNVDFVDAYLAAFAEEEKLEGIYSFDRDFNKIPGARRLEPK